MPKIVKDYKEQARELILQAGLVEFSKNGYRGTTMSQIAKDVGVTKGNLYHYFPSKAAILRELALSFRSSFLNTLFNGLTGANSLDSVIKVCVDVLDQEAAGAQLWFDIFSESFTDAEIRNLMKEQYSEYTKTIRQALDRLPTTLLDPGNKLNKDGIAMAIMFLLTGAHTGDSIGIPRSETVTALKEGLAQFFTSD